MEIQKIFGEETIRFFKDENDELWFIGKDIAEILEYKDTNDSLKRHVETIDKQKFDNLKGPVNHRPLKNQQPHTILINEFGLYSLVMKSNQPKAKQFQRWVYGVIKEIRETGKYEMKTEKELLQIQLQSTEENFNQQLVQKEENFTTQLVQKEENFLTQLVQQRENFTTQLSQQKENFSIQLTAKDAQIEVLMRRYVPSLLKDSKNHVNAVFNKNNPVRYVDPTFKPYYAMRVQKINYPQAEKKFKEEFPGSSLIYLVNNPNPTTSFNFLKESGLIEYHGNHFKLLTDEMIQMGIE